MLNTEKPNGWTQATVACVYSFSVRNYWLAKLTLIIAYLYTWMSCINPAHPAESTHIN
jgi:hypothetical protein